jgi:hypothetical protein
MSYLLFVGLDIPGFAYPLIFNKTKAVKGAVQEGIRH